MTRRDVAYSLCDYAQKFIRKYVNKSLKYEETDAIVVGFINYFVREHCAMELKFYTQDLFDRKRLVKRKVVLERETLVSALEFRKQKYIESGILDDVNENEFMNQCEGKADFYEEDAIKVLNDFIKGYIEEVFK